MATMTNMSTYEIEDDSTELDYSDEILSSEWNPDVGSIYSSRQSDQADLYMAMPSELTVEISDLFLNHLYAYQE